MFEFENVLLETTKVKGMKLIHTFNASMNTVKKTYGYSNQLKRETTKASCR